MIFCSIGVSMGLFNDVVSKTDVTNFGMRREAE